MRFAFFLFIIVVYYLSTQKKVANANDYLLDFQDGKLKDEYQKTYAQERDHLQKTLLTGYDPTVRPVRNQSEFTLVHMHVRMTHLSIDQHKQTMTINGNLFLGWRDAFLGWNPKDHNGMRNEQFYRWELWGPRLRLGNGAHGVDSSVYENIYSYVRLMNKRSGSNVIINPKITLTVTCSFDFADYPYDENTCSIFWYSVETMDKIQLHMVGDLGPSFLLSYGGDKSIVSDFKVVNASSFIRYSTKYMDSENPPYESDWPITTSVAGINVKFVRHAPLYISIVLIPILICAWLGVASWFMTTYLRSLGLVLFSLLIHFYYIVNIEKEIPINVSKFPACLIFYGLVITLNVVFIFLHLAFEMIAARIKTVPKCLHFVFKLVCLVPKKLRKPDAIPANYENAKWCDWFAIFKPIVGVLLFFFYLVLAFSLKVVRI